jgi:hypothetical protein
MEPVSPATAVGAFTSVAATELLIAWEEPPSPTLYWLGTWGHVAELAKGSTQFTLGLEALALVIKRTNSMRLCEGHSGSDAEEA